MSTQFRPLEITTIVSLLFGSGPAAIARLIIFVVVDTIKLMMAGWFSAEFVEKDGIIVPDNRKLNSTSTVVFPIFVVEIATSIACSAPRFPFWRSIISMARIFSTNCCVFSATTGLDSAAFQVGGRNDVIMSADTLDKADDIPPLVEANEMTLKTKLLANKIDDLMFRLWAFPIFNHWRWLCPLHLGPSRFQPGVVSKATKQQQSSSWAEINLMRWQDGAMTPVFWTVSVQFHIR